MSTTIEQLELEVQSSATSAVAQLDTLASTLGKLKSATKGGAGLTSVAKQLTTLNNSLNGVSSDNAEKLNKLAQGLQTLSTCGNLKLSSSVANQITNLGTAVRSLNGTDFSALSSLANALTPLSTIGKSNLNSFISQLQRLPQAVQALNGVDIGGLGTQISQLVSALAPLSQMGKNNLTSFVTQLGKIPDLMKSLQTVNIGELASQIQQLADAFAPLATQMQAISSGFASFPARIQKLITSTNNLSTANDKASKSYVNLAAKISIAIVAVKKAASVLASFINKSNEYVEDLNLFTVSMGEYASAAQEYAERVSEILGIDPAEWMRNQGVFMTITKGFGVASDRAYTMSQNLTQLGYDISSFFNIPFEESMQKLQSGISGELEPLRRLGYDLSVARLQEEAYALGIDKKVSAMTQAEKAELRYYAIMTQVTAAQGDMARTLEAPANQLRILQAQVTQCARAIGNIFIPMLNAILPYAIAVAKVIRLIANAIASLFGFSLPEVDYSGLSSAAGGASDVADNLGDATDKAKELKNALLGIDELNVISENDSSSSGVGDIGGVGGLGFDLPTYDFLGDAVSTRIDEIVQKMKEWLGITDEINSWSDLFDTRLGKILLTVTAIGAGFAAWKIAKGVQEFIKTLTTFKGFGSGWAGLGAIGLISDLNEFVQYFQDFLENGATFQNVVGMISEFTGSIGDCLIILGNLKVGGALKVAQGIGEIAVAIKDISESGVNWDNANTAIRGLTNIAIGIGVFTGNLKVAAWSLAIQGFTSIITEIGKNWDAVKQGDWSGVDKATLIIGALEVLGGLAVALDVFSKLKGLGGVAQAATAVDTVAEATGSLDTAMTPMNNNLKNLAQKLGWGIVIVAEVSAAAVLVVGAVWILGEELGKVAEAWQPVIENAGTVAIAVGVGAGLIAAVGLAAYGLGTLGGAAALNIGIGTAILLELGIATGLFLVEIWGIGKGLDEIRQAWQPVLDNAPTVETAIATGTALLVAIGVVTAALGVATVASAGLLPLAIGLGTAILVELAAAFVLFTESLIAVADEIGDNLSPALRRLNPKLPVLKDDMSDFTEYMTDLADEISSYSDSMGSITWSSIANAFQRLFAGNPIGDLADDVNTIYNDTVTLNGKLQLANPELALAVQLMTSYADFMNQLQILTQSNSASTLATDMFTNLQIVGENLVTGFVTGINNKISQVTTKVNELKTTVNTAFSTMSTTAYSDWDTNLTKMVTRFDTFKLSSMTALEDYSTEFLSGWKTMWRGAGNTFVSQWNIILDHLENGINDAIDAINDVIREFNRLSALTGVRYSYVSKISIPNLSYMKDGGFVDEGQLFIAREAGAEMVGAIGRKTAVANNDQIVEGISTGVSIANEGVIAAIYALINAVEDKDMSVSIGDEDIGHSYDRYKQRRGVEVSSGVFANSY